MKPRTDDVLKLARQMEQAVLGKTFDEVRTGWKPQESKEIEVSFRRMFDGKEKPLYEGDTYVTTDLDEKVKVVDVRKEPNLEGWTYTVETETGERKTVHESAIKTEWKPTPKPKEPLSKDNTVKEGVPEGFYKNTCLVDMNKGFMHPDLRGKMPKELECWNKECDEPLTICGYPFYICENNHAFNHETGEKWNWKGYDIIYEPLVQLYHYVSRIYQSLFFPKSRKREHTEADKLFTDIEYAGFDLYDRLKIEEVDPYHWGRDNYRHFAGLRFAINILFDAWRSRKRVILPEIDMSTIETYNERYKKYADYFQQFYTEQDIITFLTAEDSLDEVKKTFNSNISKPKSLTNFF